MGGAALSYPIELPAGRRAIQPQLSINYSSGGGDGWLGMGWDISAPSIGIDTRWGVPRFDAQNETALLAAFKAIGDSITLLRISK